MTGRFVIYKARRYDLWPWKWYVGFVAIAPGEEGATTYPVGRGWYDTHQETVDAMNDAIDEHYGRGRWA